MNQTKENLGNLKLTATAKHKRLNQEFNVLEIDLERQVVKCEGYVDKGVCIYCPVTTECNTPWFWLKDVELNIKNK